MKNLRKLAVAFALTLALGVAAFAGETNSPPCAPPAPGIMETPPCAAPAASTATGITQTPGIAGAEIETSFTEIAISVLESILPLF